MLYYPLSALINCISSTLVGIIVISKNPRSRLNRAFCYFASSVAFWSCFYFLWQISEDSIKAIFWCKALMLGAIFIPSTFLHFSLSLVKRYTKTPKVIKISYLISIFFSFLTILTPFIVKEVNSKLYFNYYPTAGLLYAPFLFVFFGTTAYALYLMHDQYKLLSGTTRNQIKYVFLGTSIGFLGGATNYPLWYDIPIPPLGNIFVSVYVCLVAYAIIKYHLMDIRLAVTRVGIFICVYTLVLGIPFALGLKILGFGVWLFPISLMAFFATVGPSLYLYLQRKAEDSILQEERRIQDLLVQASYGMNAIHDLKRLLRLIIVVTIKTLRVDMTRVYLFDQDSGQYVSKATQKDSQSENGISFNENDSLIHLLKKENYPLVQDELKILSDREAKDTSLNNIVAQMQELSSEVIVPITIDNSLLGFLVLGERPSKRDYSKELLNTLSVLGNQAALAIKNCHSWEAETKRLEEEGARERIASLDHMASSMAHEIDNPMHIVRQSLGFIRDFLLTDPRLMMPGELKKNFEDAIARSLGAAERVSAIIKAILDYSKIGKGEFKPVVIQEALDGFSHLIDGEVKKHKVRLDIEVSDPLPLILGDRIQVEEIFVNFVQNAIHAVKGNEGEKRIVLKIFKKDVKTIRIECVDNGYGIEKKLLKDIFLASTTTKGSSEGTGLGLFRVRQIVDAFGGSVWAESEGKGKGAVLIVELSVYDGKKIARIDPLNPNKKKNKDNQKKKEDGEQNDGQGKDQNSGGG